MAAGPSWNDDELSGLGFTTDAAAVGDGSLIAITKQLRVLLTAALTANAATSFGKTITFVSVAQGAAGTTALAAASVGNNHKLVGAILIVLIRQSIRTLHFDQNYEWIIIGCAIIIAVVLDRLSQQIGERRLAMSVSR